jgi:hypothetical protein
MEATACDKREARAQELEAALAQCWCTHNYYVHPFGRLRYTDGVKIMGEVGGAYWLIDAIASYQGDKRLKRRTFEAFQLWELKVNREVAVDPSSDKPPVMAVLTCRADSDVDPVITQEIEYTDFPLDYIRLFVEGGVLLLPSEH